MFPPMQLNNFWISYFCTQNMSSIIKSYNKKVITKNVEELKPCNCRIKSECTLNGQCQVTSILYKYTILSSDKPRKVYLGTAECHFMKRFYNHRRSFNNENSSNNTTLSKYMWELKETSNSNITLVWFIAKNLPPYSNISKNCLRRFHEKLEIIIYLWVDELLNKMWINIHCRQGSGYKL